MKNWDGHERRKNGSMNHEERDLLIRIDSNLINLIGRFDNHVIDDKVAFKKNSDEIDFLKKITYMGLGILIVVNLALKLLIK